MPYKLQKTSPLPDYSMRVMLRILEEEGLSTDAVLDAAGMPEGLPVLPGDVAPTQEFAFQRAFVETTGYRPDIWVRTGSRYHLPCYADLGMALLTSSNLEEFVDTGVSSRNLDYSLATIEPIRMKGVLVGQTIDVSEVPETLREFTAYRDLGAILTALQDVWTSQFPVGRVQMEMPSPCRKGFSLNGHEITFRSHTTAIVWDSCHSQRRLFHGDAVLHAAYLEECRVRGELREASDELIDILVQALRRGDARCLSLTGLAAETGTSERTLQRRLQVRGVKFRDLLDEARRQVALELLGPGEHSVAEVAWQLGYADTSSFNHAFRRWTGVSPGSFRGRRNLVSA